MNVRRVQAAFVCVAAAAVGAAGCSIGDGSQGNSTPSLGSVKQQVAEANELTKFECVADKAGVWNFAGEVTNRQKKTQTYQVTAVVVSSKDYHEVAQKKASVTVKAGATKPVKLTSIHTSKKAKDFQCQVRMVRTGSS